MTVLKPSDRGEIVKLFISKKILIMPTDTVYGIHALANQDDLIEKVAIIKNRPKNMRFIILVSSLDDLPKLGIDLNSQQRDIVTKFWPGSNTLIFKNKVNRTVAVRYPDNDFLTDILKLTGPLISTSANKHGEKVCTSIQEAIHVFKSDINYFVDGGELNNKSSSIYDLYSGNDIKQLR